MVNKTLDAVLTALYTEFGDGYNYLLEQNEQSLDTPAFVVSLIRPTSRGGLWHTYNRILPVVIHYFPKDTLHPRRECYDVAERALEAVETLVIEKVKVSGKELEIQMVENVLQIFVTYDFWTKKIEPIKQPVEEMGLTTNVSDET